MRRLSLLVCLSLVPTAALTTGQSTATSLHSDTRIERTLSPAETHSYTINLERDQYLQLAIEQRGIDVLVRVFQPDGKLLRELDSSNGDEGVEQVEVIAEAAGTYRFEVSPLEDAETSAKGKYEIKVIALRKATAEELQIRKNVNIRKAKGLALLIETSQNLDQFHLPETRVAMQVRTALMLWPTDEKRASSLLTQAMDIVRQAIADDAGHDLDYQDFQTAMRMRSQVIEALAPHDPEAALKFFHATQVRGDSANQYGPDDPELQLESSLVNQVAAADPKRAFEMAEDMLKRSYSASLVGNLTHLAARDRTLAGRLAHDMAKKVKEPELIKNAEAAFLATSLLQTARASKGAKTDGDNTQPSGLLTDDEFRDLFLKVLSELLEYTRPEQNTYPPEYVAARNLASAVAQMTPEIKTYAADRANAAEKKIAEIMGPAGDAGGEWQRYQTAAATGPVETALESVQQAPLQMRDFLYQQVANRIASAGDIPRAQEIVADRITNATQRKQALNALQQQRVTSAAEKGNLEEALRLIGKFRPAERINLIGQILDRIGPDFKKSLALQYLEQARNLVTTSVRAEDAGQMVTLLAIARTLAPHDSNRSFQITEPLVDQFNEISAAAVTLNGFGQQYYTDGELITANENPVAQTADQLSDVLATLAMFDFDRARKVADGIVRSDVRLRVWLAIAERAMEIHLEPDESDGNYPAGQW